MNLYLISQNKNNDYDTFDSAVVAAESENDARLIHPATYHPEPVPLEGDEGSWTTCANVHVELIGTAINQKRGVICASFNAG